MHRAIATAAALAALLLVIHPGQEEAPAATPAVAAVDDPSTRINEAATLDPSRVTTVVSGPGDDSMEVAQSYAGAHGMTSCGSPADAALDDVFLAMPLDRPGIIVEVTLDEALDSAGKRTVLLACQAA